MESTSAIWDYLIVTASHEKQAEVYQTQIGFRRENGLLASARNVFTLADPQGRRIGSGGSTLYCLAEILRLETRSADPAHSPGKTPQSVLQGLRIMILHAGGDSKRLPTYGPLGKIFVPLPSAGEDSDDDTLFDRAIQSLFRLPPAADGAGQIVVVSGDALLLFPTRRFFPAVQGVTALGSPADPREAAHHGVFCLGADDALRLYLQKPSLREQERQQASLPYDRPIMDLGLMSFDAAVAWNWLAAFGYRLDENGETRQEEKWRELIFSLGLDLYREICCALGFSADFAQYLSTVRSSGSVWPEEALREIFPRLKESTVTVRVIPHCRFLHFGTTRQLEESGRALLLERDGQEYASQAAALSINNSISRKGKIRGASAWVEGCRLEAPITLEGGNVLAGLDISTPLSLPAEACMDLLPASGPSGSPIWFLRCYGLRDTFKETIAQGACFCGIPLMEWLAAVGAHPGEVWEKTDSLAEASLWEARVFPADSSPPDPAQRLWMFRPGSAERAQKQAWLQAERYSAAQISQMADLTAFYGRRYTLRREEQLRRIKQTS